MTNKQILIEMSILGPQITWMKRKQVFQSLCQLSALVSLKTQCTWLPSLEDWGQSMDSFLKEIWLTHWQVTSCLHLSFLFNWSLSFGCCRRLWIMRRRCKRYYERICWRKVARVRFQFLCWSRRTPFLFLFSGWQSFDSRLPLFSRVKS